MPGTAARPLLAVDNVEVVYGVSLAVRGVSFEVPEGGAVALLGPNGAGKTSLIRADLGLLDLHHGSSATATSELDGTVDPRRCAPTRSSRRASRQVPEGPADLRAS